MIKMIKLSEPELLFLLQTLRDVQIDGINKAALDPVQKRRYKVIQAEAKRLGQYASGYISAEVDAAIAVILAATVGARRSSPGAGVNG